MKPLTPKQSRVKELIDAGKSYGQIASIMGMRYGSVHQLCHRAKVKARRHEAQCHSGTINLRRYARKQDRSLMPSKVMAANVPVQAIRAAGLANETQLAYRVDGETIVIERMK